MTQGEAYEYLISVCKRTVCSLEIVYYECENCSTIEMNETAVVPEKTVYMKRCYDLNDFIKLAKEEQPHWEWK